MISIKNFFAIALSLCVIGICMPINSINKIFVASAETITSEEFLETATNTDNVSIYKGTSVGFNMNGRTYYQGIIFGGNSSLQFNTENVNSFDFTMGHVDGTRLDTATLTIYFDGKAEVNIPFTSMMNLQKYSIDVSKASVVQFNMSSGNNDKMFALADFSVDGGKVKKSFDVPTYEDSESFMSSGFNTKDIGVKSGTKADAFNMNGRTYYQGLILGGNSYAQFNTENVNSFDFTMGHIDWTRLDNATLIIYFDGKAEDKITLTSLMDLQKYSIDVSKASVVRFVMSSGNNDKMYALANFSVDGEKMKKDFDIPTYEDSEGFMSSGFNTKDISVKSGTKADAFNMNGRTYYQGLILGGNSYVQFNTENVNSFDFTMGHIDWTRLDNATLIIYFDGKAEDKIALTSLMDLQKYSIDVSKTSVVRFVMSSGNNDKMYALANFSVDGEKIKKDFDIPTYKDSEGFISSGFNTSNIRIKSGTKADAFNMKDQTYYQGIIPCGNSYAQFNTEKVDSIDFTIGHVDGTRTDNAILKIYLDGKAEDMIELTPSMDLLKYSLDVSNASVIRFTMSCVNNDYIYALADLSIKPQASLPGDVNDDNDITAADIVLLQKYLTGNVDTVSGNADINSDGKVDVFDDVLLRRIVLE